MFEDALAGPIFKISSVVNIKHTAHKQRQVSPPFLKPKKLESVVQ